MECKLHQKLFKASTTFIDSLIYELLTALNILLSNAWCIQIPIYNILKRTMKYEKYKTGNLAFCQNQNPFLNKFHTTDCVPSGRVIKETKTNILRIQPQFFG